VLPIDNFWKEDETMAIKTKPSELGVAVGADLLPGILTLPENARGMVLFVHGSGSSRLSPRNRYVAGVLKERGIATLLFDLLGEEETENRRKVFDIELLAERLSRAVTWVRGRRDVRELPLGYFGASTGAAAALVAAAKQPESIAAVVSRGGRPDLAADYLPEVKAPTLLIVGGNDEPVIEMNRNGLALLNCEKRLEIIPGATHLFAEAGALEEVARLAADWFKRHLVKEKVALEKFFPNPPRNKEKCHVSGPRRRRTSARR
jgi:dienelactone hydrolase